MNKKDTYAKGFDTGYDIADTNINDLNPLLFTDEDLEKFESECSETESDHYRQFSPFEFFAHDLNSAPNSESLWEGYDNGVAAGIQKRIKEFKKANKKGYYQRINCR